MVKRFKYKCNVCACKCIISIQLDEMDEYPIECLKGAFEPEWEEDDIYGN